MMMHAQYPLPVYYSPVYTSVESDKKCFGLVLSDVIYHKRSFGLFGIFQEEKSA